MGRLGSIVVAAAAGLAMLFCAGCDVGVNADVTIESGQESSGVAVVNGRIDVGEKAIVTGDLSIVNGPVSVAGDASVRAINTVNGSVKLGPAAVARRVSAINGTLTLEEAARVDGSLELIQGEIRLGAGAEVTGDVDIVGGAVRLRDARVGGDLSVVTADVTLSGASAIGGRLRVDDGDRSSGAVPRIVVGPGSRVEGGLVLRHRAEVYVSEEAEIGPVSGVMTDDDIVRFRGQEPDRL